MNFQKHLETTIASTNTERGLLDSLTVKFRDGSAALLSSIFIKETYCKNQCEPVVLGR